jgi:hypothetical protein
MGVIVEINKNEKAEINTRVVFTNPEPGLFHAGVELYKFYPDGSEALVESIHDLEEAILNDIPVGIIPDEVKLPKEPEEWATYVAFGGMLKLKLEDGDEITEKDLEGGDVMKITHADGAKTVEKLLEGYEGWAGYTIISKEEYEKYFAMKYGKEQG